MLVKHRSREPLNHFQNWLQQEHGLTTSERYLPTIVKYVTGSRCPPFIEQWNAMLNDNTSNVAWEDLLESLGEEGVSGEAKATWIGRAVTHVLEVAGDYTR
eukprot:6923455-Pyramimonas_sp.AAC.1